MSEKTSSKSPDGSPVGNRGVFFSGEVIALAEDLRDLVVELSGYADTPEENVLLLEMIRKLHRLRSLALDHQEWSKSPKKSNAK